MVDFEKNRFKSLSGENLSVFGDVFGRASDNEYIDIFRIFERLINSCEKENAISLQFDSKNTILQFTKND